MAASHQLNDVEILADRVLVLVRGSVAFDGAPEDLLERGAQQAEAGQEHALEAALRLLNAEWGPGMP